MIEQSRSERLEQKRTYWKHHIDSWQETGLTQAEYCRRHNLKQHQLLYWKKRFVQAESGVSFVPVSIAGLPGDPVQTDHPTLCLFINDRFKIEISQGFDPQLLRQLIFALRGLS